MNEVLHQNTGVEVDTIVPNKIEHVTHCFSPIFLGLRLVRYDASARAPPSTFQNLLGGFSASSAHHLKKLYRMTREMDVHKLLLLASPNLGSASPDCWRPPSIATIFTIVCYLKQGGELRIAPGRRLLVHLVCIQDEPNVMPHTCTELHRAG